MSKPHNEVRSTDDTLSIWSTKDYQSFLLTLSFSAGMIAATAFMRYGYPCLYRSSQSLLRDTPQSHNTKQQDGPLDSSVKESSNERGLSSASSVNFKTRWPWDRLKTKQHSSENGRNSARPIPVPLEDNAPQFSTNENDAFSKNERCCIGSIFGIDVGGTLAKLCYFESSASSVDSVPNGAHDSVSKGVERTSLPHNLTRRRSRSMSGRIRYADRSSVAASPRRRSSASSGSHGLIRRSWVRHPPNGGMDSGLPPLQENKDSNNQKDADSNSEASSSMRRVRSMVSISSSIVKNDCGPRNDDHAIALSRFYNFARRLDMYREGVRDHKLSFYCKELDGSFHFIRFETRRMMTAMELIRTHKLHYNIHKMGGTGGGAHKFAALFQQELGITMKKQDELDSLVAGMQFVLRTVVGECYTFRPTKENDEKAKKDVKCGLNNHYGNYFGVDDVESDGDEPFIGAELPAEEVNGTFPEDASEHDRTEGDEWWWSRKVQRDSIASDASTYPYLVVTIGTGVSVLRVDGPRKYERVSGSTIGGGTYLGLIRLLTDVEDFDDVMNLAERGDPSKVDMMVGDIYGENSDALEKLGLPSNLVASSFGKLVAKDDPAAGLKQEDLARALLLMITNNIGQVAYLNAKIFQTPRIYFVGNFLRHNHISERRLSYAINYWSKGEMEALFLEHEGYFGALGAFLLAQEISIEKTREFPSGVSHSLSSIVSDESFKPDMLHRRSTTIAHFDVPSQLFNRTK
jgi:type II pantothenate kinase